MKRSGLGKVCLFVSLSSSFLSFFSLSLSLPTVLFFAVFENFFIFLKIIYAFFPWGCIFVFFLNFVYLSFSYLSVCLLVSMSIHLLYICLFMYMFVPGFVCMSARLFVCMSVFCSCIFIFSISLYSVGLYAFLFICLSVNPFVFKFVSMSVFLSVCLTISLFVYLSVCLSLACKCPCLVFCQKLWPNLNLFWWRSSNSLDKSSDFLSE